MIFETGYLHTLLDKMLEQWMEENPGKRPFTSIKIFPFDESKTKFNNAKENVKSARKKMWIKKEEKTIKKKYEDGKVEHLPIKHRKTEKIIETKIVEEVSEIKHIHPFEIDFMPNAEVVPYRIISQTFSKISEEKGFLLTNNEKIYEMPQEIDLSPSVIKRDAIIETIMSSVPVKVEFSEELEERENRMISDIKEKQNDVKSKLNNMIIKVNEINSLNNFFLRSKEISTRIKDLLYIIDETSKVMCDIIKWS